jgi:hypothetical protein
MESLTKRLVDGPVRVNEQEFRFREFVPEAARYGSSLCISVDKTVSLFLTADCSALIVSYTTIRHLILKNSLLIFLSHVIDLNTSNGFWMSQEF